MFVFITPRNKYWQCVSLRSTGKYNILDFLYNPSHLWLRIHSIQIVIATSFVVLSNIIIKMVHCSNIIYFVFIQEKIVKEASVWEKARSWNSLPDMIIFDPWLHQRQLVINSLHCLHGSTIIFSKPLFIPIQSVPDFEKVVLYWI